MCFIELRTYSKHFRDFMEIDNAVVKKEMKQVNVVFSKMLQQYL